VTKFQITNSTPSPGDSNNMAAPRSRPWIAAFLAMASLSCGSALLTAEDKPPAAAAAESFSKTLSKSPDGKYELVLRRIPDPEDAEKLGRAPKGAWASLFLVQRAPVVVVTESDPRFRTSRLHGGTDYSCFWKADSSRFAVVFDYHRDSGLVVFQRRSANWEKISLPDLDWYSTFRDLAKAHHWDLWTAKCYIDSVAFKRNEIVVHLSGGIVSAQSTHVTMRYRYTESKSGWKGRVEAISLEKE
jgi:hypothetical protein